MPEKTCADEKPDRDAPPSEFERLAPEGGSSLFREMLHFVLENKKWWLVPILVVLFLVGILVILGGTGAAPFIYTLF